MKDNSNIEWVEMLPRERPSGLEYRSTRTFVEQLKTRPGTWAIYKKYPKDGKALQTSQYAKNYPGTEWTVRVVRNNKVVYGRWVAKGRRSK